MSKPFKNSRTGRAIAAQPMPKPGSSVLANIPVEKLTVQIGRVTNRAAHPSRVESCQRTGVPHRGTKRRKARAEIARGLIALHAESPNWYALERNAYAPWGRGPQGGKPTTKRPRA